MAALFGLGLMLVGLIVLEVLLEDLNTLELELEIFGCSYCKLGAILVPRVTRLFRMWCHLKEHQCGGRRLLWLLHCLF